MASCDTKLNLPTVKATTASPTVDTLTRRQREVLKLIVEGRSNKEIARILKLRTGTVKVHVAGLFGKLGIHRRAAVAVAGARFISDAVEGPDSDSQREVERPSSARITWAMVADFLHSLPESAWHAHIARRVGPGIRNRTILARAHKVVAIDPTRDRHAATCA